MRVVQKMKPIPGVRRLLNEPEPEILEYTVESSTINETASTLIDNYKAMDEDELFDFEEIVIPFNAIALRDAESRQDYSSRAHAVVITPTGHKVVLSTDKVKRDRNSANDISLHEADLLLKTQILVTDELEDYEQSDFGLPWIQQQVPGVYHTHVGVISAFLDKNHERYVTKAGRLYKVSKTPNAHPEFVKVYDESVLAPEPEPVAEPVQNPLESDAIIRIREALARALR